MIKVENLSFSFPQKDLYSNISFTLEAGQQCAFIGTSGSGKSTLIELLRDTERYLFDGHIEIDSPCRFGYVSQFSQLENQDMTVFEYIGETYLRLQREIAAICTALETAADTEPLLEKYQRALDAFDALGGEDFESTVNKKLQLANLFRYRDQKVSVLSGGEFKLIQVIREMLNAPEVILMDEPDAFLDFDNLNALKELINAHKGIMLVITHSRYLLNHCFNKILHLENTELQEFDGRYIDYNFSLLQKKIELMELAAADEAEIQRYGELIDKLRFIASSNTDPSRGKALKARVKNQERMEARRIKAPFVAIRQPDICFQTDSVAAEGYALRVKDYRAAFDAVLLENVSFEMGPADKVALIGANGAGKTTLLRDVFMNAHESIEVDPQVTVGYLSQLQGEMLNEANTVLEEFFEAGFKSPDQISFYLSEYGFSSEILKQRIRSLSGGEKNTLQLAKVASQKTGLLLLDEPTSHLDTYSQLALEKALQDYAGAVLMISHDYYTIANCMDYVLLIEDKTIRKMTLKKFKKMVYANHFDKDYLEAEEKKKAVETKVELALRDTDFELAKVLSEELEGLISALYID